MPGLPADDLPGVQAGARMPSVLAVAREYELAAGTARQALARLQREGLVESRVGWGTFVTEADAT
ncbi:MAG: GntR family transcriptional regulator [Streptosporangiaceae bacterium]